MESFNLEPVLVKIKEEFAKRDEMIKVLHEQIQLLLKLHLNPQKVLIEIPSDLRRSADAVTDGRIVYLRRAETNQLFQFDIQTGKILDGTPLCKYLRCSMVFFDNMLITIGGATGKERLLPRSNELLCIDGDQWREVLPPMPTKRSRSTALTCERFIIVIGGDDEHKILTTVEILDTTNKVWYKGKDLPESRCCSSGTIAGGYIYILGGWRGADPVSSVLRCSVEALLNTCTAVQGSATMPCIWETLPNLPVEEAACTTFCNTLLVVGGRANKDPVREIRTYDPMSQGWIVVGYLQKPRYICFAIGLTDRLIVLGGRKELTNTEDTMEILSL